jgi:signal-transduction protein with cAMP-binding, CBS, and nucleotidyltransferase domain
MPTEEGILAVLNSIYPFRAMDDEFVQIVADNLREIHFDEGEVIYHVGDPAEELYILYSGNVRLRLPAEVEGEVLATHKQGDFFGHEVLEEFGVRRTTARAISDVTVLAIDEPHLAFLAENVPDVAEAFELMLASFNLIMRLRFTWLGENEAVYYLARRHIFFLIERLIALVTLFGMITTGFLVGAKPATNRC